MTSDTKQLYYLQDTRSYTGNCMMWWAVNGNYTSDLNKAALWSEEYARKQEAVRNTDKAWRKEYIDDKTQVTVDHQYVKRSEGALT